MAMKTALKLIPLLAPPISSPSEPFVHPPVYPQIQKTDTGVTHHFPRTCPSSVTLMSGLANPALAFPGKYPQKPAHLWEISTPRHSKECALFFQLGFLRHLPDSTNPVFMALILVSLHLPWLYLMNSSRLKSICVLPTLPCQFMFVQLPYLPSHQFMNPCPPIPSAYYRDSLWITYWLSWWHLAEAHLQSYPCILYPISNDSLPPLDSQCMPLTNPTHAVSRSKTPFRLRTQIKEPRDYREWLMT